MALYATKEEALKAAAEAEKRRAAEPQRIEQLEIELATLKRTIAVQQLGSEDRRLRNEIAAHVAQGLIAAWGESRPDIQRLAVTVIKITDTIIDGLEKTQDGNYGQIPEWNANGW